MVVIDKTTMKKCQCLNCFSEKGLIDIDINNSVITICESCANKISHKIIRHLYTGEKEVVTDTEVKNANTTN